MDPGTEATTAAGQGALPLTGVPTPLYGASPSKLLAFLDCPRRELENYPEIDCML